MRAQKILVFLVVIGGLFFLSMWIYPLLFLNRRSHDVFHMEEEAHQECICPTIPTTPCPVAEDTKEVSKLTEAEPEPEPEPEPQPILEPEPEPEPEPQPVKKKSGGAKSYLHPSKDLPVGLSCYKPSHKPAKDAIELDHDVLKYGISGKGYLCEFCGQYITFYDVSPGMYIVDGMLVPKKAGSKHAMGSRMFSKEFVARQLHAFEIMRVFSDYAEEKDLHYSLFGGHALHWNRRRRALPWDDDIDIFMDEKDYYHVKNIFVKDKKPYTCDEGRFTYQCYDAEFNGRKMTIMYTRRWAFAEWFKMFFHDDFDRTKGKVGGSKATVQKWGLDILFNKHYNHKEEHVLIEMCGVKIRFLEKMVEDDNLDRYTKTWWYGYHPDLHRKMVKMW